MHTEVVKHFTVFHMYSYFLCVRKLNKKKLMM